MSKKNYSESPVDTQPSRIKKKQQKYLAISIIILGILGWAFYSLLSGQAASHQSARHESEQHFPMDNPITHVDVSSVWMERTQNELSKAQKKTSELEDQLKLLSEQKETQEKSNQSQNETLQALQMQLKDLEQKVVVGSPVFSGIGHSTNTAVTNDAHSQDLLIKPLKGVSDDVLNLSPQNPQPIVSTPIINPSKTPDTFVPAGTFVRAVMLGGADASTGVNSQSNPTPVLFRLLDSGVLPNHHRSHLKDCVATAAAIGDISSERGLMRLERLSCVSPNHHEVIELSVEGTVFGPEGKNGVRGVPLWREGALLKRAFIAGSLSGFSQGIASQYTTTALSPTGAVTSVNNADIFKYGAAQGVGNAMDKIADYNIRRADQYHPVIQLSAGTVVDIVFLKGFYLDGQTHDNEKESILPPFDPLAALPSSQPTLPTFTTKSIPPAAPSSVTPPLPASSLPLTEAQINALQNRNHPNQTTDFFKP